MDRSEEKQILEWIYITAKQEYEQIDKILFAWGRKEIDCYGANITLRMHELVAYQRSLLRIVSKLRRQLSKEAFDAIQRSATHPKISDQMRKRVDGIKYQVHENKNGGIFAWELAKEMIDVEEHLLKKIRNQW